MTAYKIIVLTRGVVAAVSPEDFERVNVFSWVPIVWKGEVYVSRNAAGRTLSLHRFICGLEYGDGRHVDHWNSNGYDNRRCNLRVCSQSENLRNARKRRGSFHSSYKGVSRRPNRNLTKPWYARIFAGAHHHLGYFATEVEAALAYDSAAREMFGAFARLNFQDNGGHPPVAPPEVVGQSLGAASAYCGQRRRASQYVGVYAHGRGWLWKVMHKSERHVKGNFNTQEEAARSRDAFIVANGWPHRLNFPEELS